MSYPVCPNCETNEMITRHPDGFRCQDCGWLENSPASLRDRFAMAVLPGLVVRSPLGHRDGPDVVAGEAYLVADAMLEARKK